MNRNKIRTVDFTIRTEGEGDDARKTVRASVSSESPVVEWVFDDAQDRWVRAYEILGHGDGEIDRARMADGLVILDRHGGDQIGIIRQPEVRDGKLGGDIEFGCSERAQDIMRDAIAGIRRNMSVGYFVNEWQNTGEVRDGLPVYRATSWTPYEASFVPVPADVQVGVARSEDITPGGETPAKTRRVHMDKPEDTRAELTAANVSEMYRLARAANMEPGTVDAHIKEGKSFDEFRALALDAIEKAAAERAKKPETPPAENNRREFDESDRKNIMAKYSIHRAILSLDPNGRVDAGFEREISDEIAKQTGRTAQGIYLPNCMRAVTPPNFVVGDGNGSNLVATDLLVGEFIDALLPRLRLVQAGMRTLSGLRGDIAIPKGGRATGSWIAENGTANPTVPTLGQVTGTPHTGSAYTDISRKLLIQSSLPAQAYTTECLAEALRVLLETAGISGTGADSQPLGIVNANGINTVSFTPGAPTLAKLVDMWAAIENKDAGSESMAWLGTPLVKGLLRKTMDYTAVTSGETTINVGTGKYLLEQLKGEAYCEGYRFLDTTLAPAKGLIFGDFSQLVLGLWSGTDIKVDPYSLSTSGALRVVALQDCDYMIRHPESFAVGTTVLA